MSLLFSTLTRASPALYVFTSHTFTNANATGRNGPSLSQIQTAYSSQSWASNTAFLNMTTQGIQLWTVPKSGSYTIEARGGRGGTNTYGPMVSSGTQGGLGAIMRVTMALAAGQVLQIIVGQQALQGSSGSGGGGGSWIVNNSDGTLLLVAGGGGGAGHDTGWGAGGSATNAPNNSAGGHGAAPATLSNGNGGNGGPPGSDGFNYGGTGAGGAGWLSAGQNSGSGSATGGTRYIGGTGSGGTGGGFGGGGGEGGSGYAGGGGGGYSGGGGGADYVTGTETYGPVPANTACWGGGGGGGSYYIPSATLISATAGTIGSSAGTADSNGYVTITAA